MCHVMLQCRMRCPKCGAEQFRSMLGFLNHCRIHCRLTFSSQDERLQRCGVVIVLLWSFLADYDVFDRIPARCRPIISRSIRRS